MNETLHVFIDTNVFLSFFAYTGDDIEQLKQLVGSIKSGAMRLYLPRQVVDEFNRNRERRIKDSIDGFAGTTLSKGLPRLLLDYQTSGEFQESIKKAEAARDALVTAVRDDARSKNLAADKLFEALREAAGVIDSTPGLLGLARDRKALGNPPGKSDSLGDQLNWETLLSCIENGTDLHIVSKDGDYRSTLFANCPHQFLADEWKTKKHGELVLHPEIKPLLNAWFPTIKLKIDKEKSAAIEALESSTNFASTHQAIEKLGPFVELLTLSDVKRLAEAVAQNTQILWIVEDPDVADLYRRILPAALQELPSDLRRELGKLFNLSEKDADPTDQRSAPETPV
jgi:predicted nucleic acid-binding protein